MPDPTRELTRRERRAKVRALASARERYPPETPEEAEKRRAGTRERMRRKRLADSLEKRATGGYVRPQQVTASAKPRIRAMAMLDAFLQRASENVKGAVEGGDVDVSKWLIDKIAKAEGTLIPPEAFATTDPDRDPLELAHQVIEAVLGGRISTEEGRAVLTLVEQKVALESIRQIEELRELVERVTGASAKTVSGQAESPAWLKLKTAGDNDD